jgi:hypothetical protein
MHVVVPGLDAGEDTKTTSTAVYAAVDANISALLAFVNSPTLAAKRTVNMAMTPSCAFSSSSERSKNMAPSRSIAATMVLNTAATQPTYFSLMYSVLSVIFVVFDR